MNVRRCECVCVELFVRLCSMNWQFTQDVPGLRSLLSRQIANCTAINKSRWWYF